MMSCTTRRTRGRVRLASASVKNLCGTSLSHHNALNLFRVRYEPDHLLVTVHNNDRGSYMMVVWIQPFRQLEALHLRLRLHHGSIGARVICSRAVGRIVTRTDTPRDDVTIRYRAHVMPIFRIVDHGHDRDV